MRRSNCILIVAALLTATTDIISGELDPVSQIQVERMKGAGNLKGDDEIFVLIELKPGSGTNGPSSVFRRQFCAGKFCCGRTRLGDLDELAAQPHVASVRFLGRAEPRSGDRFGRGVMVGVVDQDFFWRDWAFRTDGEMRIRWLWDQRDVRGPGPAIFRDPYGSELDGLQLKAMIDRRKLLPSRFGHGFIMSHIAAGRIERGESDNPFLALPPARELVFVDTGGGDYQLLDAVSYIAARAREMGTAAVINVSYSRHIGPHDGTDALTKALEALLSPRTLLVASVGNDGGKDLFKIDEGREQAQFEIVATDDGCASSPQRRFRIESEVWTAADDVSIEILPKGGVSRGPTPFGRVRGWTQAGAGLIVDARQRTDGPLRGAWLTIEGKCEADAIRQPWTLLVRGPDGKMVRASAWIRSAEGVRSHFSAPEGGDPGFSSIAASPDILSVGAYEFAGPNRSVRPARYSSYGRLPGGAPKPDVWVETDVKFKTSQLGGDFTGSGTSGSAALVSRVAAWLWQSWPEASAEQIRGLLRGTVLCPDNRCMASSMPKGYHPVTVDTLKSLVEHERSPQAAPLVTNSVAPPR